MVLRKAIDSHVELLNDHFIQSLPRLEDVRLNVPGDDLPRTDTANSPMVSAWQRLEWRLCESSGR